MEHFSALLCFLHFKDKQEKRNERGLILILFKFFANLVPSALSTVYSMVKYFSETPKFPMDGCPISLFKRSSNFQAAN